VHNTRHILLFDLHNEGHHLFWLGLIIEAFKEMHYHISLVVDDKDSAAKRILLSKITAYDIPVTIITFSYRGTLKNSKIMAAAARYLHASMADEIFFPSLDDIASTCFRKAAFGMLPHDSLCGKISGIYVRPRLLDKTQTGIGNKIKRAGFTRMEKEGFFKNIFLLDKDLPSRPNMPRDRFHFLPDPWKKPHPYIAKSLAHKIKCPQDKCTFLFYGTASRRKGLELMLEAFEKVEQQQQCFLLFAGKITGRGHHIAQLEYLEKNGLAKTFNYYISETEQDLLFRMTDFVILPYINHYGSSGILAHAAAYHKPVIASNFHLLGKRVKEYGLGLTFENDSVASLADAFSRAISINTHDRSNMEHHLEQFARTCTTDAFKSAIKDAYPHGIQTNTSKI